MLTDDRVLGQNLLRIQFVAFVQASTGDSAWLYWTLAATALVVIAAITFLPPARAGLASNQERIISASS